MIINTNIQALSSIYKSNSQHTSRTARHDESADTVHDEVVLSDSAKTLSPFLSELKSMDDVREDRVAELSERIAAGTYHVDAEDIAQKMLEMRI